MELTAPDVDNWVCTIIVVGFEKMYDSRCTYGILEEEVGETMTKINLFDPVN